MIRDFGIIAPGTTLYIPFHTFDSNDPSASVTLTGLATTDIEIYSNGSTTQRASDSGYALLDTDGIDFDGITGIHGLSINLADNTTAGFYAAGNQYWVVVSSVTVDGATINFVLGTFRIGYPAAVLNTTIATLASQTSFTLAAGPAEDDALNGWIALIHDVASAVQMGVGVVADYTGSTRTVTLLSGVTFTAATTDNISFFPPVNANYAGAVAYSTTRGLAGTALPNAAAEAAGGLYTRGTGAGQINQTNNGQIDANAARTGGTTNTGRDIGASVLLSSGTGTGQISLSSGAVLLQATQTGVTIPTVTTLTNAPSDSSGVTTLLSRLSSTRAGYLDNLSAGAVATAAALTSAAGDITSILGKFTGITSLAQWLGLIAGKQTGNSTARTELRATGAGSGTFDETTDSIEAIRDNMGTAQTGDSYARIGANGAGLTAVPWNAAWDAEVQSEATDALNAYDPPTAAELTSATANLDAAVSTRASASALSTVGSDVLTNGTVLSLIYDRLRGAVLAAGVIGSTGNSTTALHLTGLTYGDDELNNCLLVVHDVSAGEYHARWISDWADTGDLATVATLPFTPENGVDEYWILATRQDVTGGSGLDAAGVRAAVGLASANLDTQLGTIDTVVDSILADTGTDGVVVASGSKTGYAIGTGGISAASFAAGAVDAAAIAADAIGASELAAGAATEIATAVLDAATSAPIAANVKAVNDVTLTGDGNGTPWGPA